jgi:hypothetical protein
LALETQQLFSEWPPGGPKGNGAGFNPTYNVCHNGLVERKEKAWKLERTRLLMLRNMPHTTEKSLGKALSKGYL